MTMQVPPEMLETAVLSARAVLDADEKREANERAMKRWAELISAADKAQLEHGFALFELAEPEKQWLALRDFTLVDDLYRCLLSDMYLDEYKEGRSPPPTSPMWNDLLIIGGYEIYSYFRAKFVRLWNRNVKEMGLEELAKPKASDGLAY